MNDRSALDGNRRPVNSGVLSAILIADETVPEYMG